MDRVIVTIEECSCGKCFDLELPTNLKLNCLILDVVQTLSGYMPELTYKIEDLYFKNKRTSRNLSPNKTLYEERVRNGDILIMKEL